MSIEKKNIKVWIQLKILPNEKFPSPMAFMEGQWVIALDHMTTSFTSSWRKVFLHSAEWYVNPWTLTEPSGAICNSLEALSAG